MKRFFSLLGIILSLLILTSCGSKKIEGKVEDVFGNPLSNVKVKIDKSTFSTTTNSSGEYSIDYAPGNIKLYFIKDGYTTQTLTLNIQQKSKYPAEKIVLYPIPKERGMYYVDFDKKRLVKLNINGSIKYDYKTDNFFSWKTEEKYFLVINKSIPILKSGNIIFIDTTSFKFGLMNVNNQNIFLHVAIHHPSNDDVLYGNNINEKYLEVSNGSNIKVRFAHLQQGKYAFIDYIDKKYMGGKEITIPHKNGVGIVFNVSNNLKKN